MLDAISFTKEVTSFFIKRRDILFRLTVAASGVNLGNDFMIVFNQRLCNRSGISGEFRGISGKDNLIYLLSN